MPQDKKRVSTIHVVPFSDGPDKKAPDNESALQEYGRGEICIVVDGVHEP